jgi:O-antigen ligase
MRRPRIASGVLVLGAAACPAVVALPLGDQFALPKLALGLTTAGLLVALCATPEALRRLRANGWPAALAAAFLCWLALATVFADRPYASVLGTYADYSGLLYYVPGIACFLAAGVLLRGVAALDRAVSMIAIAAAPVVAYALVQRLGLDPVGWDDDFGGRAFSTLGQPLVLGGYLAMILPPVVWLALRRSGGERAFLLLEAAAVIAALAATETRGAYMGAAAGAAFVAVALALRSGRVSRRWWLAGATATVVVVAAGAGLWAAGVVPARLRSSQTLEERVDLWRAAVSMTAERPLLGFGPDRFADQYGRYRPSSERGTQSVYEDPAASPHNEVLTVFVAGGVIGGGLYVVLWGVTLAGALAAPTGGARRDAVVWIAGGLVAYAVQAQFSIPDVALSMVAMTLLGALAGLSAGGGPRALRVSAPMRRLAAAAGAAAGGALCLAAVALLAGDALNASGGGAIASGSAAGIGRLRWAERIDPLQAAYLDDLARAQEASVGARRGAGAGVRGGAGDGGAAYRPLWRAGARPHRGGAGCGPAASPRQGRWRGGRGAPGGGGAAGPEESRPGAGAGRCAGDRCGRGAGAVGRAATPFWEHRPGGSGGRRRGPGRGLRG